MVQMIRKMSLVGVVALVSAFGQSARADSEMREFMMSCTYGVLAGTLVGAASLAFTDQPGESLNQVARGASIGLYAGILLGLYVVYIVPGQNEPEGEFAHLLNPRLKIWPILGESQIDGVVATYDLARF